MKLSGAIRLGAMMKPQAFRAFVTDDGACALGAALLAVEAASRPHSRAVLDRWPWALTVSANCPSCGRSCPIFWVITHLNDNHRWTREQIARWVAGIECSPAKLALFPDYSRRITSIASTMRAARTRSGSTVRPSPSCSAAYGVLRLPRRLARAAAGRLSPP